MKCETVKIVANNEQGYIIINKVDFNEKVQELFSEKKKSTQRKAK